MTNQDAFYIVGNLPTPFDDENYDIWEYQEAKAMALDALQKLDDLKDIIDKEKTDWIGSDYLEAFEKIKLVLLPEPYKENEQE